MKDKRIAEAFDLLRPSKESDEKIITEILEFSRELVKKKNRRSSVVKMFASVAACFLFVFAAVRFLGIDLVSLKSKFL